MVMALDFYDLVTHCAPNVGVSTIAAIVKTESSFDPLAININVKKDTKKPKINPPKTQNEAIATAKWLLANHYNIDMGLGQINSANLSGLGLTVEDMFSPCSNIKAASVILTGNYKAALENTSNQQAALHAAISAYNTGSQTKGFTNGYVDAVLNNATLAIADIKVPELNANSIPKVIESTRVQPASLAVSTTLAAQQDQNNTEQQNQKSELLDDSEKIMIYESKQTRVMVY